MFKLTIDAHSKANNSADKPNEDAYLVDTQHHIYIVADGVTRDRINGAYPNPSPARAISQLFVKTAHEEFIKTSHLPDIKTGLTQAVIHANIMIKQKNIDYTEFAPGTTGIVTIVRDDIVHYVHIGDSSVYVVKDGVLNRLTTIQTALVHEHYAEFTKQQVRNDIANNINHPYGYGVLNGHDGAVDFLEYGQIKLTSDSTVLIASDGLDVLFEQPDFRYTGQSAEELIVQAVDLEDSDETIRSDDKTVIIIRAI